MLRARNRKHTNRLLQMLFLNTARFVLVCVSLVTGGGAGGGGAPLYPVTVFYTGRCIVK
jgi:hypothetical protein